MTKKYIICYFTLDYLNLWSRRGDFLRSVPCVTVWHQKIKFYTVSAGEKSLKTYLVYVPMITKTVGATSQTVHTWTPGLCMSHSDVFGKTSQKNISWTKKIHISTYKMHFRVVVAVNLKSFTFCNSNIHVTQWLFQ